MACWKEPFKREDWPISSQWAASPVKEAEDGWDRRKT
jgi:hypothetical protein